MGKNFAARARPGVPPPPGSPSAQGLGCSCPFEKNQNLTGPFNNVWLVAAHCPVHGWDANPDPGVQGQATIIQAIAEALPALRQRFRVKDLWLSRSVAHGEVTRGRIPRQWVFVGDDGKAFLHLKVTRSRIQGIEGIAEARPCCPWPNAQGISIASNTLTNGGETMDGTRQIAIFQDEAKWLQRLKVGDPVLRWLGGSPIKLVVTGIKGDLIICGGLWEFLRKNGAEFDPELGWGLEKDGVMVTGSYIRPPAQ
jgi:hypothetical protein